MTKHVHSLPSPEEERMVLDAFYGRVARTVVLLLVAAGVSALVGLVLAPAAYQALGRGLGALIAVKAVGALLLGGLLTPILSRTAFADHSRRGFMFALLALMNFGLILMRPTRDAGLEWLDSAMLVMCPLAIPGLLWLRKRLENARHKEPRTP